LIHMANALADFIEICSSMYLHIIHVRAALNFSDQNVSIVMASAVGFIGCGLSCILLLIQVS
jgi:hypothetical protein